MLQIKHKKTGEVILEVEGNDLSGTGSSDRRFIGVNLEGADLRGQSLFYGDFSSANLRYADLSNADISNATFNDADLMGANLLGASAISASFCNANLERSTLVGIMFWLCAFDGARFDEADVAETSFLECEGLGVARGLDRLKRFASAGLDRATLVEGISGLPDEFLLRAGYTTREIEFLRPLYAHRGGKEMLSCFVSNAEADDDFAQRLIVDLRRENVQCWHYTKELIGGRPWREQIRNAIKSYDRLLLICSRRSIYRPNVVEEIIEALNEQRVTGKQKLFPVRLDDHILSKEFQEEAREKVLTRQWGDNWVPSVLNMHILDFSHWDSDPPAYRSEFSRLLDALERSG